MDQVINALNELHQRATSAINALQQGNGNSATPAHSQQQHWLANRTVSAGGGGGSRDSNVSNRRVHFAPPFASLSPLGRAGGGKSGDSSSKKHKKQQEEEEERILISEVRLSLCHCKSITSS